MKIGIVSVPVSDQQRAKAFYRDVLDFSVYGEVIMESGETWLHMLPPSGHTGITLVNWFDTMAPGSLQGLVLETDDIRREHADLKSRGLQIDEITDAEWGRFAMFSDPDGNGWVLTQPAPQDLP